MVSLLDGAGAASLFCVLQGACLALLGAAWLLAGRLGAYRFAAQGVSSGARPPSGTMGRSGRTSAPSEPAASMTGVLDALPLPVVLLGNDQRVCHLNAAARRLFGEEGLSLMGCTRQEALAALIGDATGAYLQPPDDDTPLTANVRLGMSSVAVRGSEAVRAATVSIVPVQDDRGRCAGSLIALQLADDRRGAPDDYGDLLLLLSHELRSPLAYISASAELLMGGQVDPPVRDEILAETRHQSDRLALLLENMLDASRLRSGHATLDLAPLPLPPLLHKAAHNLLLREKARSVRVEADSRALPFVLGDELRVEIILRNLLENAAKYSPPEGEIVVRAERGAPGYVRVSVVDQGAGVLPEQMGVLFGRFRRVGGTPGQGSDGHGLGLYICETLVAAQGGEIGVHSREGRGTTFWFTLRIADEELMDE